MFASLKKSEALTKILVATLLLVVPLYPKFPFISVPGTYVSIRIEDFFVAAAFTFLLATLAKKAKIIFSLKLERSIAFYLVVGFVSLLSAVAITKTAEAHLAFFHWARRIEYFIPFFLGVYAVKDKNEGLVNFVVWILAVVTFLLFFYGVGQKYLNFPVIITQNYEYSKGIALRYLPGAHINSTFAGHYDLASFLVLTLPTLATSLFLTKEAKYKVFLGGTFLFGLWLLSNTLSRISIFSFLVGVSISFLLIRKYKALAAVLAVSLLTIAFSSTVLDRYLRVIEVAKGRLGQAAVAEIYAQELPQRAGTRTPKPEPVSVFEDRSVSIRLNVEWPRAIRSLKKNPLLGTGYSSITLATDNDYLRAIGETGILGFLSFLLVLANLALLFFKAFSLKERLSGLKLAFIVGMAGSLVGVLINATFIDIFEASKFATLFWLLMGIGVSLIRLKTNEKVY